MSTSRSRMTLGLGLSILATACGDEPGGLTSAPTAQVLAAEISVPPNYGIHDTFVRDGLAFVCAWNTGIIIYDVGNGLAGGSPTSPVEVSRLRTNSNGVPGARAHNGWWFHNPNTGERRYLFVGQEGPGQIGGSATGDIHVVDVADLASPREVASYHLDGAGAHNFWMDEAAEILFAAYYNGGVVALDVSGSLSGSLASRELARIEPAGPGSYVWGIGYRNGSIYATDMLAGLFHLTFNGTAFSLSGAGTGEGTDRFFSDLWVTDEHVYTGTWGTRGDKDGNVVNIWRLDAQGRPSRAGEFAIDGIGTVADVEVSADGAVLLVAAERGPNAGLHLLDVSNPERPRSIAVTPVQQGIHTATLSVIDGTLYAFAARNPPDPALLIFEIVP